MVDTPLNAYQRVPPPSDPDSAQGHLDGELQKLERTTRETIAKLMSVASTYATIDSPVLTGDPKAPTPTTADNDTSIATTAFVKAQDYATHSDLTAGLAPKADTTALSAYATTSALSTGLAGKEPSITGGTTDQFWRGDKTWQTIAQKLIASYVDKTTATTSLATVMSSASAPTITSGTQIFSRSVTTTSATQVIEVIALLSVQSASSGYTSCAIFNGSTCVAANPTYCGFATVPFNLSVGTIISPGAAGTYTITLRAGPDGAAVTLNGLSMGGKCTTTMITRVIEP